MHRTGQDREGLIPRDRHPVDPEGRHVDRAVPFHVVGRGQLGEHVDQIAGKVALIHSVDRLSLAEEIDRQWGKLGQVCPVLIEVNVAGEASKSGTTAAAALELVRSVAILPHVRITGLIVMTIGTQMALDGLSSWLDSRPR